MSLGNGATLTAPVGASSVIDVETGSTASESGSKYQEEVDDQDDVGEEIEPNETPNDAKLKPEAQFDEVKPNPVPAKEEKNNKVEAPMQISVNNDNNLYSNQQSPINQIPNGLANVALNNGESHVGMPTKVVQNNAIPNNVVPNVVAPNAVRPNIQSNGMPSNVIPNPYANAFVPYPNYLNLAPNGYQNTPNGYPFAAVLLPSNQFKHPQMPASEDKEEVDSVEDDYSEEVQDEIEDTPEPVSVQAPVQTEIINKVPANPQFTFFNPYNQFNPNAAQYFSNNPSGLSGNNYQPSGNTYHQQFVPQNAQFSQFNHYNPQFNPYNNPFVSPNFNSFPSQANPNINKLNVQNGKPQVAMSNPTPFFSFNKRVRPDFGVYKAKPATNKNTAKVGTNQGTQKPKANSAKIAWFGATISK